MKSFTPFFILMFIFLVGCTNKEHQNTSTEGKTIHLSLENPKEVDLKDLFSSITITPLEISDNSVIGRLFKGKNTIVVPNKYYIVFDKYYTIYLFDMQGKFISNSKQCIGDGPKTYQILQDVAYNPYTNTIDVLDAKNVIYQYDINFKYVTKYKITHKSSQIFRYLYAIDKESYALFDRTEKDFFTIYNVKDKSSHKVTYPGFITFMSSNFCPFHQENSQLYFSPLGMNNNLFNFSKSNLQLSILYTIDNGKNCLSQNDIQPYGDNAKDVSLYLNTKCTKYVPLKRLFNDKYLISTYMKEQNQFINICYLESGKNMTFQKSPALKENLPTFFQIEDDILYAILFPSELSGFINPDLIENKDILQQINEEDNPVIIQYKIKH